MPVLDNCQLCFGQNGGVEGNENHAYGLVICDRCFAKILKIKIQIIIEYLTARTKKVCRYCASQTRLMPVPEFYERSLIERWWHSYPAEIREKDGAPSRLACVASSIYDEIEILKKAL